MNCPICGDLMPTARVNYNYDNRDRALLAGTCINPDCGGYNDKLGRQLGFRQRIDAETSMPPVRRSNGVEES